MELIWAAWLRERLRQALLQYAPAEHGGAILAHVDHHEQTTRFLAVDFELPQEQEVAANEEDLLWIDPAFWARTAKRAKRQKFAVLPVHTHPFGRGIPHFSWVDRTGEGQLLPVLERLSGLPSAAVVIGPGGESVEGWTEEGSVPGVCRDIGIGPIAISSGKQEELDERFDRHIRAFGAQGQQRLKALTVGVVGASGTGSHVCEQLIRLGVGRIVVVDPDQVEEVNLNRIVTAFANDATSNQPKVATIETYARMVGGPTVVEPVQGTILDSQVISLLTSVDGIFGCTDTLASRAILNRLAIQRFIPYWDCGTEISAGGQGLRSFGRVRLVLAGGPCLLCMGVIDPEALRVELLPPTEREREEQLGYIRGANVAAPAVVALNGTTASLAVMSFLRWAVGDQPLMPAQWTYRGFAGDVRLQTVEPQPDCPICNQRTRLGRADLSVIL